MADYLKGRRVAQALKHPDPSKASMGTGRYQSTPTGDVRVAATRATVAELDLSKLPQRQPTAVTSRSTTKQIGSTRFRSLADTTASTCKGNLKYRSSSQNGLSSGPKTPTTTDTRTVKANIMHGVSRSGSRPCRVGSPQRSVSTTQHGSISNPEAFRNASGPAVERQITTVLNQTADKVKSGKLTGALPAEETAVTPAQLLAEPTVGVHLLPTGCAVPKLITPKGSPLVGCQSVSGQTSQRIGDCQSSLKVTPLRFAEALCHRPTSQDSRILSKPLNSDVNPSPLRQPTINSHLHIERYASQTGEHLPTLTKAIPQLVAPPYVLRCNPPQYTTRPVISPPILTTNAVSATLGQRVSVISSTEAVPKFTPNPLLAAVSGNQSGLVKGTPVVAATKPPPGPLLRRLSPAKRQAVAVSTNQNLPLGSAKAPAHYYTLFSDDDMSLRDIVLSQLPPPYDFAEDHTTHGPVPNIVGRRTKLMKIPHDLELNSVSGYLVHPPVYKLQNSPTTRRRQPKHYCIPC